MYRRCRQDISQLPPRELVPPRLVVGSDDVTSRSHHPGGGGMSLTFKIIAIKIIDLLRHVLPWPKSRLAAAVRLATPLGASSHSSNLS